MQADPSLHSTQDRISKIDRYVALQNRELAVIKKHDAHQERINAINDQIRNLEHELRVEQGSTREAAKEKENLELAKKKTVG